MVRQTAGALAGNVTQLITNSKTERGRLSQLYRSLTNSLIN